MHKMKTFLTGLVFGVVAIAFAMSATTASAGDGWEMDVRTIEHNNLDQHFEDTPMIYPRSNLFLSITESGGLPGDTVTVSVWAELSDDYEMSLFSSPLQVLAEE